MPHLNRAIMSLLPEVGTHGAYLSTSEVHLILTRTQPDTPVQKTVQRRLEKLEAAGLLEMEKRGRAWVWRKKAGASGMAAKAGALMEFDEALALQTLRRFSSRQIPTLVTKSLSALFKVAEDRLQRINTESERCYARWSSKVAVESGGFALRYPVIDGDLFSTVSQALFYERKLEVVYRPRSNATNDQSKIILPLGLVEVGGLVYLIGGTQGRPNPTMYRMDRLERAVMMLEPFQYPASFSLDNYVKQQRQFDFMVEKEVLLELRFFDGAGDHLFETPFAADQEATRDDGYVQVQGSALLSQRLRWWIRSFGPNVEVLAPASLRAQFAQEARALTKLYKR